MKIGLVGPTTSGKSTICQSLIKEFGGTHVCIDDFYIQGELPKIQFLGKEIEDWETPKSIDWDKFEAYVESYQSELLFIDSFLLFYSEKITSLIDAAIIINYQPNEFKIAQNRRIQRNYQVDVPEDYHEHPNKSEAHWESLYFEEIAWPFAMEHQEYIEPKNFHKPMLKLSATNHLDTNISLSKDFIRKLLNK